MEALGSVILLFGVITMTVGGFWALIKAFETGIGWGLAVLFLPFASLIWISCHWDRARKPVFMMLLSLIPVLIGSLVAGK